MLSLLLTAALATTALADFCTGTDYPCTSGVLVLVARGTDTDYRGSPTVRNPKYDQLGPALEDVARNVTAEAGNGSYCRALPYAAAPGSIDSNPPFISYFLSIGYGIDVGQGIIKDYVGRCGANSKIALLGYSQGGQTMTSVLIGDIGKPSLDAYKQYIIAGAFFASPSWVVGFSPIDAGNSTTSGLFARDPFSYNYFNKNYGNKIRTYCQAGDTFCANGGPNGATIHQNGVETYRVAAEQFLATVV